MEKHMRTFKLRDDHSGEIRLIEAEKAVDAAKIFFADLHPTLTITDVSRVATKIRVSGFRSDPLSGTAVVLGVYVVMRP
jgi:hypothetical protein